MLRIVNFVDENFKVIKYVSFYELKVRIFMEKNHLGEHIDRVKYLTSQVKLEAHGKLFHARDFIVLEIFKAVGIDELSYDVT